MKLLLASIILGTATAQLTPARLRSTHYRNLKGSNDEMTGEPKGHHDKDDSEKTEFGHFEELDFMMDSMSTSLSMTMTPTSKQEGETGAPTSSPVLDVGESDAPTQSPVSDEGESDAPTLSPVSEEEEGDAPTPSPVLDVGLPTASPTYNNITHLPSYVPTYSPTEWDHGKSAKANKKELLAYSWDLPAEYTGYFEIYEGQPKGRSGTVDDLELIDTVELGTGTSGSASSFLPRELYTIVVVNQNQTVGYCCEGSTPGWIHFTYGGIEFDRRTKEYSERRDKDKFVAEFHKKPHKIDVGDDGAFYEFSINL